MHTAANRANAAMYTRLLENLVLPMGDLLLGTSFIAELKRWRTIQWLSADALVDLQKQNLGNVLRFAIGSIPYYARLDIDLTGNPYHDLARFPVVGKLDLKADPDAFVYGDRS